ncbi:hypothetical protein [Azospirillum sp.]|uniref:hypothetical protein n=1 Tax=Azospirillum sp. TaxID=34012 RepID=UPI002D4DAE21|nr:hypothetical protein [Azospirillum sp.]HYD69611.1 hypothetical protein [Azospirillum sp.]
MPIKRLPFAFCVAATMTLLGACADEHIVDREEVMGDWRGPVTAEQLADAGLQPGMPADTLAIRFTSTEAIVNGEPIKVSYTGVNNGFMVRPAGSQRVFTLYVRDHNRMKVTFAGINRPTAIEVEMTRAGK